MKVRSWAQARDLMLSEAERRLNAKIKKYWVDSVSLEPKTHGGLWNIRLDLQVKEGFRSKLVRVSAKINPESGEIKEFLKSS